MKLISEEANDLNELLGVIPLSLVSICAYTDLKSNLILNRIILPMALLGLLCSMLTGRIADSLLGLAIGFGIMLIGFLKGGAAGGDVKLAGAIGTWMGYDILPVMFIACIIGLVWGVFRLQKAGMLKSRTILFLRGIYLRLVYGMQGVMPVNMLPEENNMPLKPEALPFGACLAAAAWIVWTIMICKGVGMKVV